MMPPRKRKVKRDDVARKAEVSKAVVTWVMNGTARDRRISENTIARVEEAIRSLGYTPSIWGKLINTQKSETLAFISADLTDPSAMEFVRHAGKALGDRGYGMMLYDLAAVRGNVDELTKELKNCLADGFLLHLPPDALLNRLEADTLMGKPYCSLGRHAEGRDIFSVEVDNVQGAAMAIRHLASLGARTIGVIDDDMAFDYSRQRSRGIDMAAGENPRIVIRRFSRRAGEDQFETGVSAARRWLDERTMPDAFFAMGDVMALGALSYWSAHGVRCPQDILAVSFDGTIFSKYAAPPLTAVSQPYRLLAETAVERCLAMIAGKAPEPRQLLLGPELTVRLSTDRGERKA